jgi:hypothetical protein
MMEGGTIPGYRSLGVDFLTDFRTRPDQGKGAACLLDELLVLLPE